MAGCALRRHDGGDGKCGENRMVLHVLETVGDLGSRC